MPMEFVAEHELHRQAHHRGEAQGRAHIVGEDEIGDADRHDAAMRRHAVQHRAHGVLADAVVDIAAVGIPAAERGELALVPGRPFEVGSAREQLGDGVAQEVDDVARELDPVFRTRLLKGAVAEGQERALPAVGQATFAQAVEQAALLGGQGLNTGLPSLVGGQAAPAGVAPGLEDRGRHLERRMRPVQILPRGRRDLLGDAGAVGGAGALDLGQAAADHRGAGDHRRPGIALREQEGGAHRLGIVTVHLLHVPVAEAEPGQHVVRRGDVDRPVVGHAVVVPQESELAEPEMAGQRDHLVPDAFLQAAVTDQRVGMVVDELRAQPLAEEGLGHGHAGGIGDPLAERAGGDLDPGRGIELGMTLAVRAQLAKGADLAQRDLLVARQIEQRVEQHRAVPVRFHEAVAVEPGGIGGIEPEVAGEECRHRVGGTQRRAGVPFAYALDRIDRQEADRVGHQPGIGRAHRPAPVPFMSA